MINTLFLYKNVKCLLKDCYFYRSKAMGTEENIIRKTMGTFSNITSITI